MHACMQVRKSHLIVCVCMFVCVWNVCEYKCACMPNSMNVFNIYRAPWKFYNVPRLDYILVYKYVCVCVCVCVRVCEFV